MNFAIETSGLTRYFGTLCAVHSLNLRVPTGCVYGLLGLNGSGKTTTIRMLLGLLSPTRGSAKVLGEDCNNIPPSVRDRIGYVAEGHHLYGTMKIRELASFNARFFSGWDQDYFDDIISHFSLDQSKRIRQLSNGQRAQVSLSLTLATQPELLIMDDPTMGVDPVVRRHFLESVVRLIGDAGRTVLFSSHVLSDVERVADRIGIMQDGVLRVDCTLDEFKHQVRQVRVRFKEAVPPLDGLERVITARIEGAEAVLTVVNFDGKHNETLQSLGAEDVEMLEAPLEDLFIDYNVRGNTDFSLLTRR